VPADTRAAARLARDLNAVSEGIPHIGLIAGGPIRERISAAASVSAIARGLRSGGAPEPDLCPLPLQASFTPAGMRLLLEELAFDARMRACRALIVCESALQPSTLAASATFELATRARQAGVPAFAVTGENGLGSFEARILDLQAIEQARGARSLVAAGERLARML